MELLAGFHDFEKILQMIQIKVETWREEVKTFSSAHGVLHDRFSFKQPYIPCKSLEILTFLSSSISCLVS